MLIDRPTPATRNGLGNVIHGWPKWMLCQAFKKHKLCSSWRVKKSLFSGNCQVGCCLHYVLQLGHHTPHKISVSSGFKLFCAAPLPSSLLPWCLICNSVPLRILGNVHTGSILFSAMLHLCRDALVGQKLRLLSFQQWTCLVSSSAHPFPLES